MARDNDGDILFGSVAIEECTEDEAARHTPAASSSSLPAGVTRSGCFVDEALALADRLTQLASATEAVALASGRPSGPVRDTRSAGVCTDVHGDEFQEWERADTLMAAAEADVERMRAQVAASLVRCQEAQAKTAAADAEEQRWAGEAQAMLAAAPELARAQRAEAEARSEAEAHVRRRTEGAEEELLQVTACEQEQQEEHAREALALEQEITNAEARTQRARAEASELMPARGPSQKAGNSSAAAANEAARALKAIGVSEARGDALEEERASLKEELGTLRFALKDTKSFQNRRAQELDAQVQRLEKQRRKLEEARRQSEDAHANASETQAAEASKTLALTTELNARLTADLFDVDEDHRLKEEQEQDISREEISWQRCLAEQAEEVCRANERIDELCAAEGSVIREKNKLNNQAQILQSQVKQLSGLFERLKREEAEELNDLHQTEEATQSAEIIRFKLQVAERELNTTPGRPRAVRGTGAATDSANVIARDRAGATRDSAAVESPAGDGSPTAASGRGG